MAKLDLDRIAGSAPWLKPREVQHFTAKIFKSGNSLALRLPSTLGLEAGMEMNLRVEDGTAYSFESKERPKRKFNVAKVAGSAHDLEPIRAEDRLFAERPLIWDERPELDRDGRE